MSYAIETHDLVYRASKSFELDGVSLKVPVGSIYGFLGPNGAGKTTTIRLLLGLIRARAGTITILGRAVPHEAHLMLARTGYVPERPHLYSGFTVGQAVDFHAAFFLTWDARWADELIATFALERGARVGRLSKGEMGKLMMLLALAQRPELLVLDEPTDGLDPIVRREVLMALIEYVSETQATVFISSHLVHELERVCNWVGLLDRGRLVVEMPMQSFKNGIKRLRVLDPPAEPGDLPFVLLSREIADVLSPGEVWVVRGWQAPMSQYFQGVGATLQDVVDLDLEEGFVELLRTSRTRSVQ
jgi:ABC-2 type transport system ATP-binding protein